MPHGACRVGCPRPLHSLIREFVEIGVDGARIKDSMWGTVPGIQNRAAGGIPRSCSRICTLGECTHVYIYIFLEVGDIPNSDTHFCVVFRLVTSKWRLFKYTSVTILKLFYSTSPNFWCGHRLSRTFGDSDFVSYLGRAMLR